MCVFLETNPCNFETACLWFKKNSRNYATLSVIRSGLSVENSPGYVSSLTIYIAKQRCSVSRGVERAIEITGIEYLRGNVLESHRKLLQISRRGVTNVQTAMISS